jgi:hypothetical protein
MKIQSGQTVHLTVHKGTRSGTSSSILFGFWVLCSTIIFWCFTCNLNAILFAPEFDKKIDTACDVVQRNLVLHRIKKNLDVKYGKKEVNGSNLG